MAIGSSVLKSGQTIFFKPKYRYLADIVSLRSPAEARASVQLLSEQFQEATPHKQRRIIRATQLAANRAKAIRNRKTLSAKEKAEFRQIEQIYERAQRQFSKSYRWQKKFAPRDIGYNV